MNTQKVSSKKKSKNKTESKYILRTQQRYACVVNFVQISVVYYCQKQQLIFFWRHFQPSNESFCLNIVSWYLCFIRQYRGHGKGDEING